MSRHNKEAVVFALDGARALGESIARKLSVSLGEIACVEFEDGEHRARPVADVDGRDVFVIQSLYQDGTRSTHDRLCRLLFFLGAVRDAAPARLTAVIPYLCYARVDRRIDPHDPVTTRYVAELLEAVGVQRVIALDVHNVAAFQNAFRCMTDHVEACGLFANHFAALLRDASPVVLSPDIGGIKRAEVFRETLAGALGAPVMSAFMEKHRIDEHVEGERVVGDLQGRAVIVLDDMICSGRTLSRAVRACERQAAAPVYAAATHGVFTADAETVLNDPALTGTVITDSIPYPRPGGPAGIQRLTVLSAAAVFAGAIKRIHSD